MTTFLLPEIFEIDEPISLRSSISDIQSLTAKGKTLVALRLGLTLRSWQEAPEREEVFWARGMARRCKGELLAARCKCGPFYKICPQAWSNPPEGFLADATIKHNKIMVCGGLFPFGSIDAQSDGWDLWLPRKFHQDLLSRNPSQNEINAVCRALVDDALKNNRTYTRAKFIAAVKGVTSDASQKQVENFRKRNRGPCDLRPLSPPLTGRVLG